MEQCPLRYAFPGVFHLRHVHCNGADDRLIYQPDFREVSWSIEDRLATWDGHIEYIRLQAVDATNLVFKLKLSQAGGADVRIGVRVG